MITHILPLARPARMNGPARVTQVISVAEKGESFVMSFLIYEYECFRTRKGQNPSKP